MVVPGERRGTERIVGGKEEITLLRRLYAHSLRVKTSHGGDWNGIQAGRRPCL